MDPKRNPLIAPYDGAQPALGSGCFIAPGVVLIGTVRVGADSSIWFNSTVRGDVHTITIGEETNVQDNSVLHVTHDTHPLVIGNRVTCGHAVRLHGCTIEDEVLVGIGATVLDGAIVRSHSMIAAGAVVTPGTEVPSGVLVAGVPAKPIRELRPEEIEDIHASAKRYVAYAQSMEKQLSSL
jgi:carbonic anhydrase/acetyltransferase-like protein (isoleucine patch superfamily)